MKRTLVLVALLAGSALAQSPEPPALTGLEACHIDVSLLNEALVRLKIEKAELEKRLDILQLQLDRERRTPAPKDGMTWSWKIDPKTGRPEGYVKPAEDKKD